MWSCDPCCTCGAVQHDFSQCALIAITVIFGISASNSTVKLYTTHFTEWENAKNMFFPQSTPIPKW